MVQSSFCPRLRCRSRRARSTRTIPRPEKPPLTNSLTLRTPKGTPIPNPNSTGNPKFGGSCPVRGPRGARIRTRLAAQCRLHQKSAQPPNSSPISRLNGNTSLWGWGFLGNYSKKSNKHGTSKNGVLWSRGWDGNDTWPQTAANCAVFSRSCPCFPCAFV